MQIKAEYKEVGDLGVVAENARSTQKTMFAAKHLTLDAVFKNMLAIAAEQGSQSQKKKQDRLKAMMVACRGPEARYVVRLAQVGHGFGATRDAETGEAEDWPGGADRAGGARALGGPHTAGWRWQ